MSDKIPPWGGTMPRYEPLPIDDTVKMISRAVSPEAPFYERLQIVASLTWFPHHEGNQDDVFQQLVLEAAEIIRRNSVVGTMFAVGDKVSIYRNGWDNAAGTIASIPDAKFGTGQVYVVELAGGNILAFGQDELRRE